MSKAASVFEGDRQVRVLVEEITATLLAGKRHRTPGLGTFSTCTRKATKDRCASTMAMFRASAQLRAHASGGPAPRFSGPHTAVLAAIVEAMQSGTCIDIPRLGRMAVVPVPGRKPKLIFHGARELNRLLARKAKRRVGA